MPVAATMGEMHRTLRALRAEEAERSPARAWPSLDDVLDGARKARRVRSRWRSRARWRELGAALDASAFRIVQEAVTNVVRHAGGAPPRVIVRYGDAALELVVADEGRGEDAPTRGNAARPGRDARARRAVRRHAHRAARDGRGFEVHATLPYGAP